ncbi:HNH endonuclease [Megasphaera elsdenii]|uniref:HNH endonuclease n=1 Tax=Megasphaera elsdenii TaxID=907 RepID=A0A848ERV0_MEGEL|nr:HNH endonuclease [Megasphaera elsdenii]
MSHGKLHNFYCSAKWTKLADLYRKSHFYICEKCGAPNSFEVHHVKELDTINVDDPTVSLNTDNLILLCHDCHNRIHHRFTSKQSKREYRYDKYGHVVSVDNESDKDR